MVRGCVSLLKLGADDHECVSSEDQSADDIAWIDDNESRWMTHVDNSQRLRPMKLQARGVVWAARACKIHG